MRTIRFTAVLLSVLLVALSAASCAESGRSEPGTAEGSVSGETPTEAGTDRLEDSLPQDLNYGDQDIVILSRYREGWSSGEIAVPDLMNEPVNDAVYERNRTVEGRLGVRIQSLENHEDRPGALIEKVATAVKTNTRDYDIVAAPCYTTLNETLNGTFADLRASAYLDFAKPWWLQGFNEAIEYDGAQFAVTGAALLSMYRFTFVTLFNKDLFREVQQPDLYDTVWNGDWTLDYQASLLPLFHRDNGNNEQDTSGDVYGLASGTIISVDPYWSSCEVPILRKDETGAYESVFDVSRLHAVAEKVMGMFYESEDAAYIFPPRGYDEDQTDIRCLFGNGGAAMATLRLLETEAGEIRGMSQEFGIVPMPKFSREQEKYRTLMHDQFTVLAVPSYVRGDDLNRMSAVMEALASDSYYRVKPAYYELTMRTKIAQDPQSARMLDMVMDNVYIDAGVLYTAALDSFHGHFRLIVMSRKNTVASEYKGHASQLKRGLRRLNLRLGKLLTP